MTKYWFLQLACFLVAGSCALSNARGQINVHRIEIGNDRIGSPPVNFEFLKTGEGSAGNWTVVSDATTDKTERRFSIAVYKPLSIRNLAIRARV